MARALGVSAGGESWDAALADPRGRVPVVARVRLAAGQALVSSERHERSQGLIGVAVVAADVRSAAQWSAALISLDPGEARERARQQSDVAVVLIEAGADGTDVIWVESGLQDRLVLLGSAQSLFRLAAF
jgi:thiamine biosynthesis lipoprotein ApbE